MHPLILALVVATAVILTLNVAILAALAWLSTRPDPVDEHWLTAAALLAPDHPDLLSDWVPRTPEEEFADEVEAWLCAQTCDREEF